MSNSNSPYYLQKMKNTRNVYSLVALPDLNIILGYRAGMKVYVLENIPSKIKKKINFINPANVRKCARVFSNIIANVSIQTLGHFLMKKIEYMYLKKDCQCSVIWTIYLFIRLAAIPVIFFPSIINPLSQ